MVIYSIDTWRLSYYSIIFFGVITLLIGCNDNTGITEVKWDRDSCERCRMVLSDRHFAVQVRGGPKNKVYHFDDIGCAVHWLKEQSWSQDQTTKIWVTDYRDGQWLDARTAQFVFNQVTPMNFGLGATAKPVDNSVTFEIAKARLLLRKHQHILQPTTP